MKQRQFIKVVGTSITGVDGGRLESTTSRGIINLKRGQTLVDFVTAFLNERGILSFSLHQRGESTWGTAPMMFLNQEPKRVTPAYSNAQQHQDAKQKNAPPQEYLQKHLHGKYAACPKAPKNRCTPNRYAKAQYQSAARAKA